MAGEEYLNFGFWFPIFVALFSIFLAWFGVRLLEKEDEDGDETLNKKIKATLSPDQQSSSRSTVDSEDINEKDILLEPESRSRKIAMQDLEEKKMTAQERENERRIQEEQLQSIFHLMEVDKDKYGVSSISDVEDQLKRYKTE